MISMNPHLSMPVQRSGAPLDKDNPVVIAVHGRNQEPTVVLDIFDRLDCQWATCLAPEAADHRWYPAHFMASFEKNEPYLGFALEAYDRRIQDLINQGVTRDRMVLLGFSQGACLTAEYAVRHPARYKGIAILTGGIIGPPGTKRTIVGSFEGTPTFIGCSDVDEWIPVDRVYETANLFRDMDAEVTERIYPGMGHVVNDDEIADIREIINR
jgi:phospholipase/carboxylesterase